MAITSKQPITQPEVVFQRVHLERFSITQPATKSAKKQLVMRTVLVNEGDEVLSHAGGRVEFESTDFDATAVEMYCKATGETPQQALAHYATVLESVNDADILTAMAYFQRGLALIYEFSTGTEAEVGG
jgi:hypothetical protein